MQYTKIYLYKKTRRVRQTGIKEDYYIEKVNE